MSAQADTQTQPAHQMAWSTYITRKTQLELTYSNAIECIEAYKALPTLQPWEVVMLDYNEKRFAEAQAALNELEHEYYGEWYGYSNTMRSVGKVY